MPTADEARDERIESYKRKLGVNIVESERQASFAGERLGVFTRLRELERDRKRYARKLIELDPEHESEYSQHLMF